MIDKTIGLRNARTIRSPRDVGDWCQRLPKDNWNGKIEMVGNGGYSSTMAFKDMGALLSRGCAAVATDAGHSGDDPDFATGHPEAIVDRGHRAVHVSIVAAKSEASIFYGQPPKHAYFSGCSTGGHQALTFGPISRVHSG